MKFFKNLLLILLAALLILGIGYQGVRYIRRPDYDLLTKVELRASYPMAVNACEAYKMELVDGTWFAFSVEDPWGEAVATGQKQLSVYDVSALKDLVGDLLEGRPIWKWSLKVKIRELMDNITTDLPTYRYRAEFSDGSVIEGERYGSRPYGFAPLWYALEDLLES